MMHPTDIFAAEYSYSGGRATNHTDLDNSSIPTSLYIYHFLPRESQKLLFVTILSSWKWEEIEHHWK